MDMEFGMLRILSIVFAASVLVASAAGSQSQAIATDGIAEEGGFSRLDGQDPAGFDLGGVEIAPRDYQACRAICSADDRCLAFNVYTPAPYDKGYCWVKHHAGPTRPDPASVGGVRTFGRVVAEAVETVTFVRSEGRDAAGNDLGMIEVPVRDYQRCAALCAAHQGCRAFNLYTPPPHDKSFCWLKHTAGPMRDDVNSVAGVRSVALDLRRSDVAQEQWIYFAANGGGFGWRQPPSGTIPSVVEVISRTSAPITIAGRQARWSYYTVTLNCTAQSVAVTRHAITTEAGERIADAPLEGPKPINSDTPPQAAGMAICNGAALPGSQTARSREAMLTALRGGPSAESAPVAAVAPSLGAETQTSSWATPYMDALEPLYALAPDAPNAAFYRSLSRPAGPGRHEMWVVAVLRGVSNDGGPAYDMGASLYAIDCNARTTQVLRGQVYRDMVPVRDTPTEPVLALQPGTVTHQMIIQACDRPPLPAFVGAMSQVRRAVPLAGSAPPRQTLAAVAAGTSPVVPQPSAPSNDCRTSATGCEFGIVAHMSGYSVQVGHQWRSSGPWQNRIRLYTRPWGSFVRPVTVCGRALFAGPDQMNKTVEGWLNPRREALATRFSLNSAETDLEICNWGPGGRGGSLN